MHMADALITPAVGGAMWASFAGITAYAAKKIKADLDERKVPLMGVLGAFIFSAQMINIAIPGTGSSGHLGGGLILAILLGPHAGFVTMASVLTVQSLFFADGGLLALGCNIFNLGFFPCYVAYPFVYKKIVGEHHTQGRILAGSFAAAIVGLQLGALAVVIQTVLSSVSALPFDSFLLLMQPIHLAIGVIEGLATTGVILFVWKARPEVLANSVNPGSMGDVRLGRLLIGLLVVTVITGGALSWFASTNPDGLEWAVQNAGAEEIAAKDAQDDTAVEEAMDQPDEDAWPLVRGETSLAGIVGGALCLLLAGALGVFLKMYRGRIE
ncbi:MAG: energy-coupling factor ABC transporter permease [Planctomycetota bacterium]|jgi:cobalt/nickel transport system permease protein